MVAPRDRPLLRVVLVNFVSQPKFLLAKTTTPRRIFLESASQNFFQPSSKRREPTWGQGVGVLFKQFQVFWFELFHFHF